VIMGPPRHLSMLPELPAEKINWSAPFDAGLDDLLARRGSPVTVLVSGDPFWFGAGTQIVRHLDRSEWRALPGISCFSLAASALGWAIDSNSTFGLHATPFSRLRPHLCPGRQFLVTLRDGPAVTALAAYLAETGFGESQLTVLESLGSSDQIITTLRADDSISNVFHHPLMVGIDLAGSGRTMPQAAGLSDDWFDHDGQITKSPVRALTLSALAPRRGQHLWDLGAGSGSVSIEWLLSGSAMQATAVEQHPDRAARIQANAARLGVDWLQLVQTDNLAAIDGLARPDTVFIGGGLCNELLDKLWQTVPAGTRLVANAVTIETDRVLTRAHERLGGQLSRMELSQLQKIGRMRGWQAGYPITQWAVIR
jgi:precorrin-6Y C5,15-methyltransferase (decarboxylating)